MLSKTQIIKSGNCCDCGKATSDYYCQIEDVFICNKCMNTITPEIVLQRNDHTIKLTNTSADHINIFFDTKYLGDIHFSSNHKGETIPQLFVIKEFTKDHTINNGNHFYRWNNPEEKE